MNPLDNPTKTKNVFDQVNFNFQFVQFLKDKTDGCNKVAQLVFWGRFVA